LQNSLAKNKVLVFYLFFGAPLLLLLMFLAAACSLSVAALAHVLLGYCWNLTLLAPELNLKVKTKKYRLSFVRFCHVQYDFLALLFQVREHPLRACLARSLPPLLWSWLLSWMLKVENNSFFTLGGSLVVEMLQGWRFTMNKRGGPGRSLNLLVRFPAFSVFQNLKTKLKEWIKK
jgi:hypothetical protein